MFLQRESYFKFGADTVSTAHENRMLVTERTEVKHAAESTDVAHRAGALGALHMFLDAAYHFVARLKVHTGRFITFCHII